MMVSTWPVITRLAKSIASGLRGSNFAQRWSYAGRAAVLANECGQIIGATVFEGGDVQTRECFRIVQHTPMLTGEGRR